MVLIPGGRFLMGNDSMFNEKPRHEVTLSPFLISISRGISMVTLLLLGKYKLASQTTGRADLLDHFEFSPIASSQHRIRRSLWEDNPALRETSMASQQTMVYML